MAEEPIRLWWTKRNPESKSHMRGFIDHSPSGRQVLQERYGPPTSKNEEVPKSFVALNLAKKIIPDDLDPVDMQMSADKEFAYFVG